jgi:hypothetical protein
MQPRTRNGRFRYFNYKYAYCILGLNGDILNYRLYGNVEINNRNLSAPLESGATTFFECLVCNTRMVK